MKSGTLSAHSCTHSLTQQGNKTRDNLATLTHSLSMGMKLGTLSPHSLSMVIKLGTLSPHSCTQSLSMGMKLGTHSPHSCTTQSLTEHGKEVTLSPPSCTHSLTQPSGIHHREWGTYQRGGEKMSSVPLITTKQPAASSARANRCLSQG